MAPVIQPTRRIAVLDGHHLSDRAVDRVANAAAALVLFSTDALFDATDRFRALRPDVEVIDGGIMRGDVREAVVRATEADCQLLAVAAPQRKRRFLWLAINGAIDAAAAGHTTVAVLVMAEQEVEGDVAVFSNTGEASGYGLAFALEIAMRRGVSVHRVLPKSGLYMRRAAEVGHRADVESGRYGVSVRYRKVGNPLETVIRGRFSLAVHSVLDVMGRRPSGPGAPARLAHDANMDAVLWLLRRFKGDVLLVADHVRLREGRGRDAVAADPEA